MTKSLTRLTDRIKLTKSLHINFPHSCEAELMTRFMWTAAIAAASVVLFVCAPDARAAFVMVAADDASDAAYDDGWQEGDNGGFGFFPWDFNNSGSNSGHFSFTSTQNGFNNDTNGDGDIDTGGRAWGMFANSGELADAFRGFQPLAPGDVFKGRIDNGFIDNGGVSLMALRSFGGDNRFELLFIGGDNQYRINDGEGDNSTGISFTDQGLEVRVELTSLDTYDLDITTLFDGTVHSFPNRSLAGPLGAAITNVRGANVNAGGGSERNVYLNSLMILRPIPEPSTFALLGLGACGMMLRRRRSG